MLHVKFVNNGTLIFFVVIKNKNLIRKNLKLFRYSETEYNIVLLFNKININLYAQKKQKFNFLLKYLKV